MAFNIEMLCIGIAIRLCFIHYTSGDLNSFLLPWINEFRSKGFLIFSEPFSNYNPLYLYFLYFISLLSSSKFDIVLIKLLSTVGDFAAAIAASRIAADAKPGLLPRRLAFLAIWFSPFYIKNAMHLGQCDALYAAAILWSLYFGLRRNWLSSIMLFSLALCFKNQAFFFFGFLFSAFLAKEFRFRYFLWIPFIYLLSCVPAWIAGGSIHRLFFNLAAQADYYKDLNKYAANLYFWISNSQYLFVYLSNTLITALFFMVLSKFYSLGWASYSKAKLVWIAASVVFLAPFMLPKMHDRYFFLAESLLMLAAILEIKMLPAAICMVLSSLALFFGDLFGLPHPPETATAVNCITFLLVMRPILTSAVKNGQLKYLITLFGLLFFWSTVLILAFFFPFRNFFGITQNPISIIKHRQDWGEFRWNRSGENNSLRLNGKSYSIGFSTHAQSNTTIDTAGKKYFSAICGLDDEGIKEGDFKFRIYAKGVLLFESSKIDKNNPQQSFRVQLDGTDEINIETDSLGSNYSDHVDCVEIKLE